MYIARVFFEKKLLSQRKYNGKSDTVKFYEIHNKEWSNDPTIIKYKTKYNKYNLHYNIL